MSQLSRSSNCTSPEFWREGNCSWHDIEHDAAQKHTCDFETENSSKYVKYQASIQCLFPKQQGDMRGYN